MKNQETIKEIHLDVLKEIGNIGAGNAATSLATILDESVNISVPVVQFLDIQEVTTLLGGAEKLVIGILIDVVGEIGGMMMFLLEQQFAKETIETLLGRESSDLVEVDEMELSVLKEIGNILAGSYLRSLAELTGMDVNMSVPAVAIDMAGALLSVPAIHYGEISDQILMIEDRFIGEKREVKSHLLLVLEEGSLERIMERLGVA